MMKEMDPQEYIHILFLCHNNLRSRVNYYAWLSKEKNLHHISSQIFMPKPSFRPTKDGALLGKKYLRWWSFKSLRMVELHEFTSKIHQNPIQINIDMKHNMEFWGGGETSKNIFWNCHPESVGEMIPNLMTAWIFLDGACSSTKFFWRVFGPPNFCPPWQKKHDVDIWYPMVPFFS